MIPIHLNSNLVKSQSSEEKIQNDYSVWHDDIYSCNPSTQDEKEEQLSEANLGWQWVWKTVQATQQSPVQNKHHKQNKTTI